MHYTIRGSNLRITNADGTYSWRKGLENSRDPFVMIECDEGHIYVAPRQDFRWGVIPECPTCAAIAERQAA